MYEFLRLCCVAGLLAHGLGCIPGAGIGGDSFDANLVATIPSLDGDPQWEAEPVPLVVDIQGAPRGATVTALFGGVPYASFHWPEQDRVGLVLGQTSSTWMFLLTVIEDADAKYGDAVDVGFGVHWSNPSPVDILVCDGSDCAPASDAALVSSPVQLRPGGAMDGVSGVRWFVDDEAPVVGDPSDGGLLWTWNDTIATSHDVRVQVVRDAGLDSFGTHHFVTGPWAPRVGHANAARTG